MLEQQRAEQERHHMATIDFANRVKSLLLTDLRYEQLKTVAEMLNCVADSVDPRALANFYEGMAAMAVAARADEAEGFTVLETALYPHAFVEDGANLDNPMCASPGCGRPPADKVHGGTE